MRIEDIELGLRLGRVGAALAQLARLRGRPVVPGGAGEGRSPAMVVEAGAARLRADGFVTEARVLELGWAHPELGSSVGRARRVGLVVGVVALVVLLPFCGGLAFLPAIAAELISRRAVLRMGTRRVVDTLPADDRSVVQLVLDRAAIADGRVQVGLGGAAAVGAVAAAALALGILGGSADAAYRVGFAVAGLVLGWAAVDLWGVAHRGASGPRLVNGADVPVRPVLPAELEAQLPREVVLRRPRVAGPLLAALTATVVGGLVLRTATPAGIAVGAACVLVAIAVLWRAGRTRVVIDGSGITEVGLVRTRQTGWDQVHSARAWRPDTSQRLPLEVVDVRARRRVVARTVPFAHRLVAAAAINARATGAYPGSRTVDPTIQYALAGLFGLLGAFAAVVVLAMALGGSTMVVDPAELPPGRAYWSAVDARGRPTRPYVECPSVVSWIGGDHDPVCDGHVADVARFTALAVLIAATFVVVAVLLVRSVRNPRVGRHPPDPLLSP